MQDQTTTGHSGRPMRAPGSQPVTALSAAVLMAARTRCHENRADFAARAQLSFHVVEGAEDGTRPAWALPYAEFMAISILYGVRPIAPSGPNRGANSALVQALRGTLPNFPRMPLTAAPRSGKFLVIAPLARNNSPSPHWPLRFFLIEALPSKSTSCLSKPKSPRLSACRSAIAMFRRSVVLPVPDLPKMAMCFRRSFSWIETVVLSFSFVPRKISICDAINYTLNQTR